MQCTEWWSRSRAFDARISLEMQFSHHEKQKTSILKKVNSKTKTTQLRRVHILYEFIHGCTESLALFVYIVLCYTAHRNIVVANSERCFDIRLFSQFYLPRTRTHTKAPAISTSRIYKINFLLRMCVYFSSEDSAGLFLLLCLCRLLCISRADRRKCISWTKNTHLSKTMANCMCMNCDDHDKDDVEAKTKQIKSQFEIEIIFMLLLLLSTRSCVRLHSQSVDDLL